MENISLKMAEYRDARVRLIVCTQDDARTHVVADVAPVQIVPETLLHPVDADLKSNNNVVMS